VNTFVITVSPMDKSGHFSLGTNNDYASTVLRHCDYVIVEVNPNMPACLAIPCCTFPKSTPSCKTTFPWFRFPT
jgi:acyl-CoA hydrolase